MEETQTSMASLLAQSDALYSVSRYDAATERARDAARLDPQNPRAYWAWSRALCGAGRFAEAATMADESIRLAPQAAQSFRLRSIALSSLARSLPKGERGQLGTEAVNSAREAVRLAPFDPNGHIALAQALPMIGEIHEADRAVQEALRLAPNSAATWVTASLVAITAKNWKAAETASRRALELDPDNYAALNNLGVALRAGGRSREGTRVLAEAARRNPDGRMARQNLSRAGLNIARVIILVALIPIGFIAHGGFLLYLVFAVGSNIFISRRPDLVLRMERWAAPIALFFAGKPRREAAPGETGTEARSRRSGPGSEQRWSATAGHSMHVLGNPVLIFCAAAAWSVALVLAIGEAVPGSDKTALAIGFIVFAAVGALPAWVVVRRRRLDAHR